MAWLIGHRATVKGQLDRAEALLATLPQRIATYRSDLAAIDAVKSGAQWTIATAREYVSFQKDDPWTDYWKSRQSLTSAQKALGIKTRPAKAD